MRQESQLIGASSPPETARNGGGRQMPVIDVPTPPSVAENGGSPWWEEDGRPTIDRVALARFGIILVIVVEAMTFAGLISAFLSIKASLPEWPPLDQPRFPMAATAINTAILLASGLTLLFFRRLYRQEDSTSRQLTALLAATALLGALFVSLQGVEWARLIGYGLTLTSTSYGSIFYVIIGFHALHVVCGLLCLGVVTWVAVTSNFPRRMASLEVVAVFWFFVVLVWPILYGVVYF